ncbi:MAG: ABC transporter substrate-binding protein [Cyanobacteria bacterium J06638_22]
MAIAPNPISRRSIVFGFLGIGIATVLHACDRTKASDEASGEGAENGKAGDEDLLLKVGLNVGNVPWQYEDEQGNFVGFEVDLVKLIAARLERPIEFVELLFTELFPAVLSGRVDLAISSITITEERMATVDFAQPYYDSDQSLTVLAGSAIRSLEGMRGKVVAVSSATTGDAWVQEHMEEYGFIDIMRYESITAAMMELKAGKYDGYISDFPSQWYYANNHPEVVVVQRIPTEEQYSMMFAKGEPLRDEVNALITQLKESGQIAEIHRRWFDEAPDPNTSTVQVADIPTLR